MPIHGRHVVHGRQERVRRQVRLELPDEAGTFSMCSGSSLGQVHAADLLADNVPRVQAKVHSIEHTRSDRVHLKTF